MGYTPPTIDYKIDFEDPLLEGIEVQSKGLTFGEWSDSKPTNRVEKVRFMLGKITSWNMETEDGTPVPPMVECTDPEDDRCGEMIPNTDGLEPFDPRVIWALYAGWRDAVANVEPSAPLETRSLGGELSGQPPIPMEHPGPQAENSETPSES